MGKQMEMSCSDNNLICFFPMARLLTHLGRENSVKMQLVYKNVCSDGAVRHENKPLYYRSECCIPLQCSVLAFGIHPAACLFCPECWLHDIFEDNELRLSWNQ